MSGLWRTRGLRKERGKPRRNKWKTGAVVPWKDPTSESLIGLEGKNPYPFDTIFGIGPDAVESGGKAVYK
jgi:hypothetical protein